MKVFPRLHALQPKAKRKNVMTDLMHPNLATSNIFLRRSIYEMIFFISLGRKMPLELVTWCSHMNHHRARPFSGFPCRPIGIFAERQTCRHRCTFLTHTMTRQLAGMLGHYSHPKGDHPLQQNRLLDGFRCYCSLGNPDDSVTDNSLLAAEIIDKLFERAYRLREEATDSFGSSL